MNATSGANDTCIAAETPTSRFMFAAVNKTNKAEMICAL